MRLLDKKVFGTLFFSIFAAVMGMGIVVPLLPVYAHDLGASGLYIGMIFGAFALSRTFFLPLFGRLSDKSGRKPFIVIGLFFYAVISIGFVFSTSVEMLIVLRFVQGIASAMIMPVVQAYVGDITPEGKEGSVMGLFNMSMFLGLSLGPILGGVIRDKFTLQASFIVMGLLAFAGFCLSLFFLPPTSSEKTGSKLKPQAKWRILIRDRTIAGLFIYRYVYTACIGIIWGFLPLFCDTEFNLSSSVIGVLVTLLVLVGGIFNTPFGFLADQWDRKKMVFIGGVVVTLSVIFFRWARGVEDLVIASVVFGIGGGISMPAHMAIAVYKGSLTEAMGSVMALLTMAQSMGMLTGSVLAGLMMDTMQLRDAFVAGSVMMAAGTVIFALCLHQEPVKSMENT
ncbi:MAG: MFS transporter [Desulfobacteraceae bacterium]|nr:MFS transporter [Desulfobacteraceae bacterium]